MIINTRLFVVRLTQVPKTALSIQTLDDDKSSRVKLHYNEANVHKINHLAFPHYYISFGWPENIKNQGEWRIK